MKICVCSNYLDDKEYDGYNANINQKYLKPVYYKFNLKPPSYKTFSSEDEALDYKKKHSDNNKQYSFIKNPYYKPDTKDESYYSHNKD